MTFLAGGPDMFCLLWSMSGVLLPLPLVPEAAAALATAAADFSTTCSPFVFAGGPAAGLFVGSVADLTLAVETAVLALLCLFQLLTASSSFCILLLSRPPVTLSNPPGYLCTLPAY